MRKFYFSGIGLVLLTCFTSISSAIIPQAVTSVIQPVSTDTLFYVDFKNLPAAFTTGDIFTASTANANKEKVINGITFGAGPNGQRINMNTGQSANQFGSSATAYVSATADDDGSTAGAFSFLKTGSGSSSGGYIILPDVQGPTDITVWSCGANTGNTQKYDILSSADGGASWKLLGSFSINTYKLIYKTVFSYLGNDNVKIKLICTTESNSNCNLYIYDVLMTKRPSIILSSSIGSDNQIVSTLLAESITNIEYTWGSIAIKANITWTGTTDAHTPPDGIIVTNDTVSKKVTISGTPTTLGTYNYSISATDGFISTNSLTGSIKVVNTPVPVIQLTSMTGTNIQNLTTGSPITDIQYTWSGSATTFNISWTGTSNPGKEPDGILIIKDSVNKKITITGTPQFSGTYSWNITSTDGTSSSATLTGSLFVVPPPILSLTSSVESANQTVGYCQSISPIVCTYGGSATSAILSWSGTSSETTPPAGITVTANDAAKTLTITGMPYLTGNYSFSATATNGTVTSTPITGKISSSATAETLVSFPGAVGYGNHATGGRFGSVYHVTNLNDSGSGSFRDAVSASNRIIVFDVSGYIKLNSAVSCKSNLTIAGQTAPGEGIGFRGGEISFANQSNIICRYIRIRPGSETASNSDDALSLYLARNVILDHCSFEFAPWNNIDGVSDNYQVYPVTGITIQHCIDANPTYQQFGAHCESVISQWTFYQNIFANSHNRNPLAKINDEFINNVHYNNEAGYTTHTSTNFKHDIVNNYFVHGPASTGTDNTWFQIDSNQSIYCAGNLKDTNLDGVLNGAETTPYWYAGTGTLLPVPWSALTSTIPTVSAPSAFRIATSNAGTLPFDQMDSLLINQVKSLGFGTAGFTVGTVGPSSGLYTNQTQTGLSNNGYGIIRSGVESLDSDNDGMPDYWEIANGSNVKVDDAMQIGVDGYTLIEHYLNWLADLHAVTEINQSVDIDLNSFTGGFSKVSPVFSTSDNVNGVCQVLPDGHTVRFIPSTGFLGVGSFKFTVNGSDNTSYTNTISVLVTSISLTNLNDLNENLSVYPNPASDHIILQNANVKSYEIYDSSGQIVLRGQFYQSAFNQPIDISPLHSGVYTLKVLNISNSTFRFIKN